VNVDHIDLLLRRINGYCVAGGFYIAQQRDVRITADDATLGLPEVKWNLAAKCS
jgi:enoyl-CoA hydratase/carnithine racemase